MRVMAQGGGRVAMTEAGLSLEKLAVVDEVSSHTVAQPVQRGLRDSRHLTETAEPV